MEEDRVRDLQNRYEQAYKDALSVQDACNLGGVLHSWNTHMHMLQEYAHVNGYGTNWINKHPVNVLFASKVSCLTGSEEFNAFHHAYEEVKKAVEPGEENV